MNPDSLIIHARSNKSRQTAYQDALDDHVSWARYKADAEVDARQVACLCRHCYYLHAGIGCDMLTPYTCLACGERHMHENTAIPTLCATCAAETGRCITCGNQTEHHLEKV